MDNSILKRNFSNLYHQQGAKLNNPDQNVEFIFGEKDNFHLVGNAYLQFNITVRKEDNTNFNLTNDSAIIEVFM